MDVDTGAENVARRIEALRRASSRFDILDCETALQVADLAQALFTQIQRRDETMDRLLAQVATLSADADAALKSAAKNFEVADAQSRLVADLNADCTKLMAALHHETMLREEIEAREAKAHNALRRIAETSNYTRSEWMQGQARTALLSDTDDDDQSDDDWKSDLSLMQYNALKEKL